MESVSDIIIFSDEDEGQPQPANFRLCPLGVQYYAVQPLNECSLIELTLTLAGDERDSADAIRCTGFVAQCCEPQNGDRLYRIWVKFMDLAPQIEERLRSICAECDLKCPFCQNF